MTDFPRVRFLGILHSQLPRFLSEDTHVLRLRGVTEVPFHFQKASNDYKSQQPQQSAECKSGVPVLLY